LEETQKAYGEAEKKVLELKKSVETLQTDCNEKEKEKEKMKKMLKTVKEKMTVSSKSNTTSTREVERLKSQIEELQRSLEASNLQNIDQANQHNNMRVNQDIKILNLEKQVENLLTEKRTLMERMEELQRELENVHEQKKAADKFIKAASQKRSCIQAVPPGANKSTSLGDAPPGYDLSTITPLTATVRPSATPASQSPSNKFHQQLSRTASIRPLAHATAPTAMISPTVPMTQVGQPSNSNLVASVSALPPTSFAPHAGDVQTRGNVGGRGLGERRPPVIARVQVQAQGREEESPDILEEEPTIDQQHPGPSSAGSSSGSHAVDPSQRMTFGKRSHVEVTDEADDDMALLEDIQGESSGAGQKRQRVEAMDDGQDDYLGETQEGQLEEDLLAEDVEEGDDDVIEDIPTSQYHPTEDVGTPSQGGQAGSREAQLQMERQLQPSPQELLRQGRMQGRVRTQLPSFSLMSGQASSGFYEETDDSTVPSTPTLFMPKRTDGFAEAVSSPVVRYPAFSFSNNEHIPSSTQSSALELPGMHLHQETRVDLMTSEEQSNVPHTPLSVVPSVSESQASSSQDMSSQREDRRVTFDQKFFPEDSSQEQNVPQQIDLTEDDDEEDIDDHDLATASHEMGDAMTEDGDEGIDVMANDNDADDLLDYADDDDVGDDIDDSDDSVDDDDEDDDSSVVEVDEGVTAYPPPQDAVEILVDDESDLYTEDEKERRGQGSSLHTEISSEEKSSAMFSGHLMSDDTTEQSSSSRLESGLKDEQAGEQEEKESAGAKPVRITRTTRGGAGAGVRPRIRRTGAGRGKQSPAKPK